MEPYSEDMFLADLPVVLSASRLSQPLPEAPAAITVIDRRTIDLSGARNIPDLLRLVPGFQVGRSTGSRVTATYHGLSDQYARNMQVLIDGRSVYDPGSGGVPWFELPLVIDDVQRVEVIRGPNSATFGANAFVATVNIITRDPSEQTGGYARVSAGDPHEIEGVFRQAGSEGNLDYRVSLRYDANTGLATRHDDATTRSIDVRTDYRLSPDNAIQAKFGYLNAGRQDGFPDDILQPERNLHDRYHYEQIRFSHTRDADRGWQLQFYHNAFDIEDDFDFIRFSDILQIPPGRVGDPDWPLPWDDQYLKLGLGIRSHRYDLEFQQTLKPFDAWRIVWGVGGRYDTAASEALFGLDTEVNRHQFRAFVNTEWRLNDDLLVNAGAMLEKYEGISPRISPRIAANYRLSPHHSIRISASKAIRMPSLVEEFSNYRTRFQDGTTFDVLYRTSDIPAPEKILSYELGYIGEFPENGLTLDVKLYRDKLRNMLNATFDPDAVFEPDLVATNAIFGAATRGAFSTGNSGHADIRGWEAAATWRPLDNLQIRLSIARAWAIGQDRKAIHPTVYRQLNDQVPHTGGSLLIAYEFPGRLETSLVYHKVGSINWSGEGNDMPGYHRTDLRISKAFGIGDSDARVTLTIQNLENDYREFQRENLIERMGFLDFSLRF